MTYFYDEENGRYVIKGAQIQYPNFSGLQSEFNAAGKKNFKAIIDEDLARELEDQGIRTTELRRRDDTDPVRFSVKIGVYPTSEMFLLSGRVKQALNLDTCSIIDMEMRKGHVRNGQIDMEFHVSVNSRLPQPKPYLRLDTMYIPISKSKLTQEYEDYEDYDDPNSID